MRLARKSVTTVRHYGWHTFYRKARRKLAAPEIQKPAWRDTYSTEAFGFVEWLDFTPEQLRASKAVIAKHQGSLDIKTINWYLPHFDHAYYGGVLTVFRFAAHFAQQHGVKSTFVVIGHPSVPSGDVYAERISSAFPALSGSRVVVIRSNDDLAAVPPANAAVATSWITAYYVLKFNDTKRKFYFVQDFEPMFHAAGSTYAQAEATYRFGFYGLTNTITLKRHYEEDYGGQATYFTPCVDTNQFYPSAENLDGAGRRPYKVFFYGRPHHWRNGFELGAIAMAKLKDKLGSKVRIVAAGQDWDPAHYGLDGVVENLGLMSFHETANLYRTCDVGVAMMFTRHPSYLPFEFMASGCLVVSNVNASTSWLLKDGENCLLAQPSASYLADTIARGLHDHELRRRITRNALTMIRREFADWNKQSEHVYQYMCHLDEVGQSQEQIKQMVG
jgi:glycosyltransferase involved in cell wall biosynthesis